MIQGVPGAPRTVSPVAGGMRLQSESLPEGPGHKQRHLHVKENYKNLLPKLLHYMKFERKVFRLKEKDTRWKLILRKEGSTLEILKIHSNAMFQQPV